MKILRSEAVDKSPGVFFDFLMLNTILKAPGPPGRLNKLKNRFFEKSQNFQKIAKNCGRTEPDRAGPSRTGPDRAGPSRTGRAGPAEHKIN